MTWLDYADARSVHGEHCMGGAYKPDSSIEANHYHYTVQRVSHCTRYSTLDSTSLLAAGSLEDHETAEGDTVAEDLNGSDGRAEEEDRAGDEKLIISELLSLDYGNSQCP